MFHHLYKVFVFLRLTLTIVDPLSATSALPGSKIISGKESIFKFSETFLISSSNRQRLWY